MKNIFKQIIIPVIAGLFMAGLVSATLLGTFQGGTNQDTSDWTGCIQVTSGVWSTTTCTTAETDPIWLAASTTKANIALDNLSGVAINTDLLPDSDSAHDLGTSTAYWANAYTDKIYLASDIYMYQGAANNLYISNDDGGSDVMTVMLQTEGNAAHIDSNADYMKFQNVSNKGFQIWSTIGIKVSGALFPYGATEDLGRDSAYWDDTYTDTLYLNSTAYLDGASAGLVDLTGALTVSATTSLATTTISYLSSAVGNISLWTNDSGYITGNESITISGDASGSGTTSIAVSVTDLTISGETQGDVLYFNGSNWLRLAADAGKYLKSGAAAVSWDTPAGAGDIEAVGDCASGDCFDGTSDGGTYLSFYETDGLTKLQVGDNPSAITITLPNATGTLLTTVAYGDLTGNPSDVITAGTGLAWSTDTLNWSSSGLTWAGNAITNAYIASSTEFLVDTTYTEEEIQDLAFTNIFGGTETLISVTYDDAGNDIDFIVVDDLSQYDNTTSSFITATLTEEQVEDYVGTMFGGTETLISVTYNDGDNDIDFVVDNNLANYDNTTSSFITATLTDEYVQDLAGAMATSNTETLITVTYQDADGTIDYVVNNDLHSYAWGNVVDADITDTLSANAIAITDGLIVEADLNADESPTDNDILTFDTTGDNFSWQTPTQLGLLYSGGTLTDTQLCVADGTSGAIDCNVANTVHAAVTITGQDYLTLSTQQITMGEIEPDDLANSDFGDFSCNGTNCSFDIDTIAAAEMANADHGDVAWSGGVASVQDLTLTSEATGTIAYFDGSAWVILATGSNDEVLLLASGVPSWGAAGVGDVISVGDCAAGACYDGSSDGGTYATFYNIDSNKTQLIASDTASDLVITLPATTGTLVYEGGTGGLDWTGSVGTIHTDNYIENVTHTGQVTGATALTITASTSAFWATKISDEEGTGKIVFNTSPTFLTGITVPANSISGDELDENDTFDWTGLHSFAATTTMATTSITRLGIGIATPAQNLHIYNGGLTSGTEFTVEDTGATKRPAFFLKNSAAQRAGFFFYGADYATYADDLRIHMDNTAADIHFTNMDGIGINVGNVDVPAKLTVKTSGTKDILNLIETGGVDVFTVLESGYIGINDSTPTYFLDINGDLRVVATSTLATTTITDLTVSGGLSFPNDSILDAMIDWGNLTDLNAGGEVAWGNIAAGELANDSIIDADIDDDGNFTFTGTWDFSGGDIVLPALSVDAGTYAADSIDEDDMNLTDSYTFTGTTFSFAGVTNLLIPGVADADGEIAIDKTNDDQFVYYGDVANVLTGFYEKCFVLENASTSDDDIAFWHPHRAIAITDVYCKTSTSTIEVVISDGTNVLETITCDVDGQADDGSIANGAFTANERMEFDIGAVGVATNWLNVCITYTITAD